MKNDKVRQIFGTIEYIKEFEDDGRYEVTNIQRTLDDTYYADIREIESNKISTGNEQDKHPEKKSNQLNESEYREIKKADEDKGIYVVYCEQGNSCMYVGKVKGITYIECEAKQFSKKDALTKSIYMSRNGSRKWKILRVK